MTTLPPWDPDEYDRRIRRERKAREREERRRSTPDSANSTIHYTRGVPRGTATTDELKRRTRMDRVMRRKRGTN